MNCNKCGSAQKEVFLLTSSVFECQNRLCSTPEQNGSGQPKVGTNPYIDAKDGVKTWTTAWYCTACGTSYNDPAKHSCQQAGHVAVKVPTTKASIVPLHLQNWRTLDEIYKEVGSFPFTIRCDGRLTNWTVTAGGNFVYNLKDEVSGAVYSGWHSKGADWKLVSVP